MAVGTHILRDLQQIVFRNRDQHAIPSMDGALSPNDRLDACTPVGEPIPDADDVVEGRDGKLYVSSGQHVLVLDGAGYERRSVFATLEGAAGGLALHPDGRLLVCVSGMGVVAIDAAGRQSALTSVEGTTLRCATNIATLPDGAIFISDGTTRHTPADWMRDLMEKNAQGRIIACGAGFERARVVLSNLAYPHGLAVSAGGRELWFTESWNHRVYRVAREGDGLGRPEMVIRNLPGYPARLGRARGGGFWLSIFALRTHLVELVLREDDYREEMMRTIEPALWIAPALASSGHYLEPLQGGAVKKLGIQKPWAPPRSYGLVARIDMEGEAVESLHSRVGGRYHGITGACEAAQGLVIVSKGHHRLLLRAAEGRA